MVAIPLTGGGMPRHRQLYLVLRDQITGGAYRPGESLPSEEALGRLFGVSRITVRRAMQDLADGGLVDRRQGLGTFVNDRPVPRAEVRPASIRASLQRAATDTDVTVVDFEQRLTPPDIGESLGLPAGADALYILRVRTRDARPVMLTEAWVAPPYSSTLTAEALVQRALYALIEASGVRLGRFVQVVSAEIAEPTRAGLLGTDIGAALLRIDRLVHTDGEVPVMHNTVLVDGRRSHIHSDIAGDEIDTATTGVLVHGR